MSKEFRGLSIRVKRRIKKDQEIEVRVNVTHNSYTGLTIKDGKYVTEKAAYFLKDMKVYYGDDLASHYEMTSATAPSPLVRFKIKATKEAPLKVVLTNSDNVTKEATTKIKFK